MPLTDLMAALDGLFAGLAILCLLLVRLRPARTFDHLIRDLDRLIAVRAEARRNGATLRQMANVARRLEVVTRASAALQEPKAPSVTAVLRGRRGRFDLLSNFFVRSAVIQERIDVYLADLRAACAARRRKVASGYDSPFNPLNLPSSLALYLGLELSTRGAKSLDCIAWTVVSAMAAAVALRA